MSFREELIEAMAKVLYEARMSISLDHCAEVAQASLDAALAYRRNEICPTCKGTKLVNGGQATEFPGTRAGLGCARCIDGRVPVDSPRLAVVDEAGSRWALTAEANGGVADQWHEGPAPARETHPDWIVSETLFSLHQEEAEEVEHG